MATNLQGDIPGNFFHQVFTNASAASNANLLIASAGFVAPANIKIKRAWYQPWSNAATVGTATSSASYRRINLYNGGTAGTGTTIIASLNITASIASRGTKAFATTTNNTVAGGGVLFFSALTVGAATAEGTDLETGVLQVEYELI